MQHGGKKPPIYDVYVPLGMDCPPWMEDIEVIDECPCNYGGRCIDNVGLNKETRFTCNSPNCQCEPDLCENMPYVEKNSA